VNNKMKNINKKTNMMGVLLVVTIFSLGFALACNDDSVCGDGENYNNCFNDCLSGYEDGYCDGVGEGMCDPDCTGAEDVDCKINSGISGFDIAADSFFSASEKSSGMLGPAIISEPEVSDSSSSGLNALAESLKKNDRNFIPILIVVLCVLVVLFVIFLVVSMRKSTKK